MTSQRMFRIIFEYLSRGLFRVRALYLYLSRGLVLCLSRVLALCFFWGLILSLFAMPAAAARPHWPNSSFSYYANEEPLNEVLRNFANSVNTPMDLSAKIAGTVNGAYFAANAEGFLDKITSDFNLLWYYDGVTLYVYNAGERATRQFKASQAGSVSELLDKIERNPVYESRFGITLGKDGRTVIVTGPPRYIELLAASIKMPGINDQITSRVFYLKHAWAVDKTFYYRDRTYKVEGVATLLRKLFSGETDEYGSNNDGQSLSKRAGMTPSKGVMPPNQSARPGGAGAGGAPGTGGSGAGGASNQRSPQLVRRSSVSLASYITSFQADERLNAVMVHDFESRIPMYESLIEKLDRRTGLVEIKATIIDIDSTKTEELGINWRLQRGKLSAGYGPFNDDGLNAGDALAFGRSVGFSTVLPFGADFIAARVQALAKDGSARILARPSVLTLDNLQAMLDLNQTFHVKVAGQYDVNLFPVTTGTLLRVTPHIIKNAGSKTNIKLAVSIEDGEFTQEKVDDLPVVKKNTINTEAIIGENESLLIGGYHYEEDQEGVSKVPFLGDIPIFGALFSSKSSSRKKNERIYVITPKIIPYSNISTAPPKDIADITEDMTAP